ncbi:hypothetical protein ACNKHO_11070 [Shigella flexneri]
MQQNLLINGELVAGEGETQPVYNPATGEIPAAYRSKPRPPRRCSGNGG